MRAIAVLKSKQTAELGDLIVEGNQLLELSSEQAAETNQQGIETLKTGWRKANIETMAMLQALRHLITSIDGDNRPHFIAYPCGINTLGTMQLFKTHGKVAEKLWHFSRSALRSLKLLTAVNLLIVHRLQMRSQVSTSVNQRRSIMI